MSFRFPVAFRVTIVVVVLSLCSVCSSAGGWWFGGLVAKSCPTHCHPMDCSQAPLSMGFSRQEYWSE